MKKRENYELIKCETGVLIISKVRNEGRLGVVFENYIRRERGHSIPKYIEEEAKTMIKNSPKLLCKDCNNCRIKSF